MQKFLIGVDEAGRGPLAGPVAVGVVMIKQGLPIRRYFKGVNDSKQLSPEKRDALYEQMTVFQNNGILAYRVIFSSAATIDRIGITKTVLRCVYKGVRELAAELDSQSENQLALKSLKVVLDGLLHAPPEYQQETIIRGDALVPVISLASIAAKVERDRLMQKLAKKYPAYGFDKHKGYGTELHRKAIIENGLCDIHRKTYCESVMK